jgi:hypothetical protein
VILVAYSLGIGSNCMTLCNPVRVTTHIQRPSMLQVGGLVLLDYR